jgi:superfamily I DNA and/or RNA helicase
MVEEAGEILESHILVNIKAHTNHLIMIGDHKQLPPKVENYKLQKVSGKG